MKLTKDKRVRSVPSGTLHKKATYTLPPDVLESIDVNWRFHKTIGSTLADSKSEYVADLVRRDAARKALGSIRKA